MPVATRDGQRIAFWSNRDGHPQIYSMKTDGSDVRRITNSPRTDLGADWSPDGQWLVFASYAEGSDLGEIVRIQADGTDRRTLARGKDASWPRVSLVTTARPRRDANLGWPARSSGLLTLLQSLRDTRWKISGGTDGRAFSSSHRSSA